MIEDDGGSSPFLSEPPPRRAVFLKVADGILRAVANNPSIMTCHGTNSYLIETSQGDFLLDPGPAEDQTHLEALCQSLALRGAGILVSHHHSDHFGLVGLLKNRTGLPVYASEVFAGDTFVPDVPLKDGDSISGLEVLYTPGHASDHLCFARDGVLFTGDHVMSWNSSIVRVPDGNMKDYIAQLARLIARKEVLCLPGHGPPLPRPRRYMERLLGNRVRREKDIRAMLEHGPSTVAAIARDLYAKQDPQLVLAAECNVEAHLRKLEEESTARCHDGLWSRV